jgi:hypothetical protein
MMPAATDKNFRALKIMMALLKGGLLITELSDCNILNLLNYEVIRLHSHVVMENKNSSIGKVLPIIIVNAACIILYRW